MSEQSGSGDATMRAWRLHEYGEPLDVLQIDTVPVPEPEAGEVRVRNQGIPLNLNDLERINGGNMMVVPPLPTIPGMEVMGVVDACGPGTEDWLGRRIVATTQGRDRRLRRVHDLPDVVGVRDARGHPVPRRGGALLSRSTSPGSACSTAPTSKPARAVLIHAAAGGSGSAAVQLADHAGAQRVRDRGHRREGRALPRARRRRRDQLQRGQLRGGRARRDRRTAASTSCSTTSAPRCFDDSLKVHRVQRPLRDDRRRVGQVDGRRAVHRPAPA